MGTKSIQLGIKSLLAVVKKHDAEILTGLGIAGMITGTVLAVKATPKALELIEEKKKEEEKLDTVEVVKTVWKCYIPAALLETLSVTCLIFASVTSNKRNAALAMAYSLSEGALKEYQDKVVETIGEKKEQKIRDEIAKDKITSNPVENNNVIFTKNGHTLCYDAICGRYFESDIESIRRAENEANRWMLEENYIALNDLYDLMDLPPSAIGAELGWNMNDGYIDMVFSTELATDGRPCLVVSFRKPPHYYYHSRY